MWWICFDICNKNGIDSYQRWTVAIPFFIYFTLFGLALAFSLPLKSLPQHAIQVRVERVEKLPDHLDGVRIERDGEINTNFRKEVIVGDGNQINNNEDPKDLLQNIFTKADSDGDKLLSLSELTNWIDLKIREHINQAHRENYGLFTEIDNNPRNGMISWDEYHIYFLKKKGFTNEYIENHDKKHKKLQRSVKEAIMRDRASWSEAARSDPDHLTLDEFLAFRHPESSHATILTLVDELLDKFDRDGDELLTENEFSSLQTEGDEEKEGETLTQGENERRMEFRNVIDRDKDGKADRMELLMYIDPKNPRHAKEEAETLMVLSDMDHDACLSLHEILNKMDLFLGSKMVDTARSFHDEF